MSVVDVAVVGRSKPVLSVSYIDKNVTVGDHYVTCEILEETSAPQSADPHHFRLVAVMAT